MRIAIHAADLDSGRIDGTRIYISSVLKRLGSLSPGDEFLIYHKGNFNPSLAPPQLGNYKFRRLWKIPFWTQTAFAISLWWDDPDALWMPATNLPVFRRKRMRTVVTVHDLAYRYFPDHFPKKDLCKLKLFAGLATACADGIISVSESTGRDILKFHKKASKDRIKVVHHGFDAGLFKKGISQNESEEVLSKFKIQNSKFILYVGAIQPRKNLSVLVEAFEKIKQAYPEMKLVLAGEKAWMWEEDVSRIEKSPFAGDIVLAGKVGFEKLPALYGNAAVFVFPSLYEGFGIPILEAFACGVPVVAADNSSLPEVGGDAALYFDAASADDLKNRLEEILSDEDLSAELSRKGLERAEEFSWENCAKRTFDYIKDAI